MSDFEVCETGTHEFLNEATLANMKLRERVTQLETENAILRKSLKMTDSQYRAFLEAVVEIAGKLSVGSKQR